MTELIDLRSGRVVELYNKMWQVLADRKGISLDEAQRTHTIRSLWAQDWDDRREADYVFLWGDYDGDHVVNQQMFSMQPVERFEIIGIYGWFNGNAGRTINALKIWVDDQKIREVPGLFLASELNDVYILDDPFYVLRTHNLRIIPNTTAAGPYTRVNVLGWGILSR